ncbi:dihydrodipicolinate reductase [Roseovarius sp. A21]|uniref:Dihydrodipicolinate reductase n=1 Tax=Roseovarius bejariae TaxID=2576383 RepID=A0A844D207_9RHOB|nr:dihydrodipicolinate reductase [Roseovarius bejariae]MRU15883.1 dihydrodipicolinate reductase [Roseovarius bejariae]
MRYVATLAVALGLATPAGAEGFNQVSDKRTFLSLVDGRELTRFGIKLDVTRDGRIKGRAFGRDVTGAWRWKSGYFCRDLYWGQMDLGPNCQAVKVQGRTLRFISDQGTGQYADLQLR